MQSKIRTAVCCMMAMLSGSCTNLGAATSEYCSVARPIYVSKDDLLCMTDLTARQNTGSQRGRAGDMRLEGEMNDYEAERRLEIDWAENERELNLAQKAMAVVSLFILLCGLWLL
jgi:hypothetical protein